MDWFPKELWIYWFIREPYVCQTFKVVGIKEKKLVTHNMPLTTFASSSIVAKGYVNVDLQVGPIRAPTKFYVIDA